jgi:hypothetical protein
MTPETENFDALRRLLKLKRCEQPPPGYFNDFSSQVIAQIRAGATAEREHPLDRLSWEVPWLQRLIEAFQAKPALAVTFGAAVCALLVGGVIYSESMEYKPVTALTLSPNPPEVTPANMAGRPFGLGGLGEGTLSPVNTNAESLFDLIRINPQPVSFPLQGSGN